MTTPFRTRKTTMDMKLFILGLLKALLNYLMYFQNLSVKRSQSSCFKALLKKEETSALFVKHQLQSPLQAKEVKKCNL